MICLTQFKDWYQLYIVNIVTLLRSDWQGTTTVTVKSCLGLAEDE